MSEVVRWGDEAQYVAPPMKSIRPQAHLLWATPDPLGAIASVARQFKGIPTYDLADITDAERREYWEETFKSHLRAPHEFVQFHFMVEGVTRSHTHQMVRQRTATFAQESLRFAVKENLAQEVPLPPSVMGNENAEAVWQTALKEMESAYENLVNSGIPAEDARGLLPHAVTTRLHWRTNLNDLLHHAGNRLCTQAQFEWRYLMVSVIKAIRTHKTFYYHPDFKDMFDTPAPAEADWQWELIATPTPKTFAPICYHTGKCEFKAIFDRACSIRDRVDANERIGRSSEAWGQDSGDLILPDNSVVTIPAIRHEEWLMNPDAAR